MGGDGAAERPGQRRPPSAARPRDADRLRRRHPAGPRPGPRPGRRDGRRRAVDGLRHRAARERGLRRCRPAGRDGARRPGSWTSRRTTAATTASSCSCSASDGTTASIDVGSHAFAWRLPGVIAGALMAACLYLLARILFRRRLVAGLVAVFVLLDGMLFVQSRIGMNDVYVGLFIVAAYTLFAAIWTGWWRWRGAFWVAMPVIGVLLGLALASKWVAAYADRGARPAAAGAERARAGRRDPRPDRDHERARLHRDRRAGGRRRRQPDVPRDHDRADPRRGRGRRLPPDRLDRRGDVVRAASRRRVSARSSSSARWRSGRLDLAIALGPVR